jgi:hypothetical protein
MQFYKTSSGRTLDRNYYVKILPFGSLSQMSKIMQAQAFMPDANQLLGS